MLGLEREDYERKDCGKEWDYNECVVSLAKYEQLYFLTKHGRIVWVIAFINY